MAYTRRTTRRTVRRRPRKYTRKYKPRPRKMGVKQPVHYFSRFVDKGTITEDGTGTETFGSLSFALNDVPGYTEFTGMFDQYKICAVKVMIIPMYNVAQGTVSTNLNYYRFISAIDYNDSTAPTSLNDLRQYKTCKVTARTKMHKRYFRPRVDLDNDYQNPGTVQPWVNSDKPSAAYQALKYGFEHNSGGTTQVYRVECVYYMKFKGMN